MTGKSYLASGVEYAGTKLELHRQAIVRLYVFAGLHFILLFSTL